MPLFVAALLACLVHLATGVVAWTEVGLLADDREMIGAAILRHRGVWTVADAFLPLVGPEATRALYRPFIDLMFWFEYPLFGIDAFGYHVVNSVMHCLTSLLWFSLVRRWSGSLMAGIATAVLFVGWAGHSEVTHWIAARVTVQSVFFVSLALWLHELACTQLRLTRRCALMTMAALFSCVAVGTRESAALIVPLAAIVSMFRSSGIKTAIVRTLPITVAVFLWLWWRASRLGTWGSGTHYGWRWDRVDFDSCRDWLSVLFAPVHLDHVGVVWVVVLAVLHMATLVVALSCLRHAAARRVLVVGAALLTLGYVGGIGLETLHVDALQNVRYSYEPVLGLCAMLGVAIAALPLKVRGGCLAVLVIVHAIVLDGNRQSWLRASAIYERMHADIIEQARTSASPVRVFDAPGVYEGAFAYLNGYTEFLFWQETASPGTNLRGSVSSTQEWRAVLYELAQAAASDRSVKASFVQWHDGTLQPFTIDPQWPVEPCPGVRIHYARVARSPAYEHSSVPVHVLIETSQQLMLRVGDNKHIVVQPAEAMQAIELRATVIQESVASLELRLQLGDKEQRFSLGAITVVPREN